MGAINYHTAAEALGVLWDRELFKIHGAIHAAHGTNNLDGHEAVIAIFEDRSFLLCEENEEPIILSDYHDIPQVREPFKTKMANSMLFLLVEDILEPKKTSEESS